MQILMTDYQSPDTDLERGLIEGAGHEFVTAQCTTEEEVIAVAAYADAMIASYAPVTRAVFESLPKLKCISTLSAGTDHIDLEAAKQRGIWVGNIPNASFQEVATTALAMALGLVRHLPFLADKTRAGSWDHLSSGPVRRTSTMTLGIVGLGRIGRHLASLSDGIFGEICAFDPAIPDGDWPQQVKRLDCHQVFTSSDVVSLHLPLTPQSAGMVDDKMLDSMRPGSYLVNAARGGLVDIEALLACLDSGQIAGAALDVLPIEPPPTDAPILSHPRAIVTPHAAYYSMESDEELRSKSVGNILAWAKSGRPVYPVVEGRQSKDG